MAGRGPAPKDPDERRRRNLAEPMRVVVADGVEHGPELPATHEWPAATEQWWHTWRLSAQAKDFTDTDWSFLLDTAVLHAEFWLGDRSVAAELRLRAAKFGATPEDRARLKIEIGQPGPAVPRPQGKDRKARLLKAVGDGNDDV